MPRFFSTMYALFMLLILPLRAIMGQDGIPGSEAARALFLLTGEAALDIDARDVPGPDPQTTTRFIVLYNEKFLFVKHGEGDSLAQHVDFVYSAPYETRIVSAKFKSDDPRKILILLSNKSTVVVNITYNGLTGEFHFTPVTRDPFAPLSNISKIIGDALYILANGKIYVSRDTAKTWAIDSAGIGQLFVQDISIDSSQYAWIATYEGIFYQHPDSNVWHKVSPLPGNFQTSYAIFVDRKDRIFVTKPFAVFVSTDRGSSWTDLSDGISGNVTSYGDDAFGTIYATSLAGSYRLKNLTPPWENISDSIKALSYLTSNSNPVNSVKGDTVIYAATKFGLFQSSDQGTTWKYLSSKAQLPAHNIYAGVVNGAGYYFVSTNLGIYRRAPGDTTWEKIFPQHGFISGINALTSDSAGNVYGNLPFKAGPSTSIFYIVKSTDHGNTWIPDTAGQGALGINTGTQAFDFWVDKQGTQYLGGNGRFYSKRPGQSWKLDTAGLGMKNGEYIADVSLNNKKGIIYLCRRVGDFPSYSFALYRRTTSDSAWQVVNTSTIAAGEGRLISDHEGNIIVRTLSGSYKIWRYDGSNWTEILLPTGIGSSPFALNFTVDKSGVLWCTFVGSGLNKGIHFTAANGTTWKYAGLDKVGIKSLSAVEDTVYAVTFIDGIFGFTTTPPDTTEPTSVWNDNLQIAKSYELYQNYPNPFNPATTITFSIPNVGTHENASPLNGTSFQTSLRVYDLLGREVAILVNEERKPGKHSVRFDAAKLSTGVYIYTLRAGNFVASKKLLLIK